MVHYPACRLRHPRRVLCLFRVHRRRRADHPTVRCKPGGGDVGRLAFRAGLRHRPVAVGASVGNVRSPASVLHHVRCSHRFQRRCGRIAEYADAHHLALLRRRFWLLPAHQCRRRDRRYVPCLSARSGHVRLRSCPFHGSHLGANCRRVSW